ncbi:MAG: DUF370 domain-containing protein [Clostridiales bacterium]|nr:DUF370 domain-containing protein [Clostridiales bacterium]
MHLINIGYGNMVTAEKVVAVVSPEAAPIRRMIQDARDRGRVIDATSGHKTRAVLVTDSDHLILSPLTPETIAGRMNPRKESLP